MTKDQSLSAPWLRVRGKFSKDRPENYWDWFPFTGRSSSQPENAVVVFCIGLVVYDIVKVEKVKITFTVSMVAFVCFLPFVCFL